MNLVPHKTLQAIVTAILPVASAILGIYLKTVGADVLNWRVVLGVAAVALLSSYVVYNSLIKPVRDVRATSHKFLRLIAKGLMDLAETDQINAELDVLFVRRPWTQFFHPWFVLAWTYHSSTRTLGALQFSVSKGVSGQAFRKKTDYFINLAGLNLDLGFSEEELLALQFVNVTAVYAWPIFRLDSAGKLKNVVGVLCLYAKEAEAPKKIAARLVEYKSLLSSLRDSLSELVSP